MAVKLFNTLTRKKQTFKPLKAKSVGIYSCGPTVYANVHIGNLRSFIFADILRRVMEFNGYKVKQVMNITDVGHLTSDADTGDDKMERAASQAGKSAWDIAAACTEAFHVDRAKLNIEPPTFEPKATDHIKDQIALVQQLEKKGYTYRTSDGMYFDTAKFKKYGKLSRQKLSDKKGGARVVVNDEKRNPTDFALWKFSPAGDKRQMEWPSPWGVGFPGWHIECSAMSVKYLGQPFDIHTGGVDHLTVHHENEIAQTEAATGKPLAKLWMHGEFLVLGNPGKEERMGKSLGNFQTLQSIEKQGIDPLAFRYLTLTTHYRKKIYISPESLQAAAQGLERLRKAVATLPAPSKLGLPAYEKKFQAAVNDDLNLPKALAVAWSLVKSKREDPAKKKRTLLKFDTVLGLGLDQPSSTQSAGEIPVEAQQLAAEREKARQERNWQRADELRAALQKLGYAVEDSATGPRLKKI